MEMMLKLHMMWGAMVLLFILSLILRKQKITVMLLRLSYLLMLGTGIGMIVNIFKASGFQLFYLLKGLLAVGLIGMMEMVVTRVQKGVRVAPVLWIVLVLLLAVVPAMGYGYFRF